MFLVLQTVRVNPRDDSWEHAVLWIVFAVVLALIFLTGYFALRFGWFRKTAGQPPETQATAVESSGMEAGRPAASTSEGGMDSPAASE